MKTKEELNALKKEVEAMNKKLAELTEEELKQVSGGAPMHRELKKTQLVCPDCGYVLAEYPEGTTYMIEEGGLYCPVCKKLVRPKEIEKQ